MTITSKYCTAEDVRKQMDAVSKDKNGMIEGIILACSRMIDGFMGYQDVGFKALTTATIREYSTIAGRYVYIDPCVELTSVKMKDAVTDTSYDVTLIVGTHVRGFSGDPKGRYINFNKLPYHGIILLPNSIRRVFTHGSYGESGFNVHTDDRADTVNYPTLEVTAKWGHSVSTPEPIKQACIMQAIRVYKRVGGGMADALLSADFGQSRFISKLDKDVQVMLNFSGLKRSSIVGR